MFCEVHAPEVNTIVVTCHSPTSNSPSPCAQCTLNSRHSLSLQPLPRRYSKWWNFKRHNIVQRVKEMQALRGGYFGPHSQLAGQHVGRPAFPGILPPGQLPLLFPGFAAPSFPHFLSPFCIFLPSGIFPTRFPWAC